MVVTRHPAGRAGQDHAAARHQPRRLDRYHSSKPSWHYDVVAPGSKYNLTDIAAAIGRVQPSRADAMRDRRCQIAAAYDASFDGLPVTRPACAVDGDLHAWHLYVLRLRDDCGVTRDDFIARMAAAVRLQCPLHPAAPAPVLEGPIRPVRPRIRGGQRGVRAGGEPSALLGHEPGPGRPGHRRGPLCAGMITAATRRRRAGSGDLKRCFDLVVASAGLVVAASGDGRGPSRQSDRRRRPVESSRQERVGRDGVVFRIHKFRTMRPDLPSGLVSPVGDPRITKLGAFLRRSKLDELPQLLDVLKGRMSLVGPRPEVPAYVALWPEGSRAGLSRSVLVSPTPRRCCCATRARNSPARPIPLRTTWRTCCRGRSDVRQVR